MNAGRRPLCAAWPLLGALLGGSWACQEETRNLHPPPARTAAASPPMTTKPDDAYYRSHYGDNGSALSEGNVLYMSFNCVGCHAHGGGGIGPALMDRAWLYGSDPGQIFTSIVKGRPGGMPAFGDKLVDDEVWKLVAYVRSLSGWAPKAEAPGREDHMNVVRGPNRHDPLPPFDTTRGPL